MSSAKIIFSMTSEEYLAKHSDPDRVRFLKSKGFTSGCIATVMKIPYSTVRRWLANSSSTNIKGGKRHLSPAQDEQLLAAVVAAAQRHQPMTVTQLREKVRLVSFICDFILIICAIRRKKYQRYQGCRLGHGRMIGWKRMKRTWSRCARDLLNRAGLRHVRKKN